jgi:hypothetical protein
MGTSHRQHVQSFYARESRPPRAARGGTRMGGLCTQAVVRTTAVSIVEARASLRATIVDKVLPWVLYQQAVRFLGRQWTTKLSPRRAFGLADNEVRSFFP